MIDTKKFSSIRREFENILILVRELKKEGVSIKAINKRLEK